MMEEVLENPDDGYYPESIDPLTKHAYGVTLWQI